MRQEHLGQIVQAVSAVEQMGTVNAVYFVACGGSIFLIRKQRFPAMCIQRMNLCMIHPSL